MSRQFSLNNRRARIRSLLRVHPRTAKPKLLQAGRRGGDLCLRIIIVVVPILIPPIEHCTAGRWCAYYTDAD